MMALYRVVTVPVFKSLIGFVIVSKDSINHIGYKKTPQNKQTAYQWHWDICLR